MAQSTIQTRLCPHCANSIALDTLTCPYCKASLSAMPPPQWPSQDDAPVAATAEAPKEGIPLASKIILLLGLLVFALGVFLVAGHSERTDSAPLLEAKDKALQESEQKIKVLEAQLAQSREELKGSAAQREEFKTKLAEQEKNVAAAQNRLKDSGRELDRLASRPSPAPLPPVRPRESSPPLPPPPAPLPAPAPRRAIEPGLYETVRSTSVHEEPLSSSRVLSRLVGGTQITVVRGAGEWLEVRSKHGNPPGFVRADDAMFVSRAN